MSDSRRELHDKFLKDRIVPLGLPINDEIATEIVEDLLLLEKQSTHEPITIYIHSPGGSVAAATAIIRTIENLEPKVCTLCAGQAHSMAAIILAAGSRGSRGAITDSVIAFSRISGGNRMMPETQSRLLQIEEELLETICRHSKMTKEQAAALFESGRYLSPPEARDLGIIDHIYQNPRLRTTSVWKP
jgi:ATP-dependent Clp protease, protease subunit